MRSSSSFAEIDALGEAYKVINRAWILKNKAEKAAKNAGTEIMTPGQYLSWFEDVRPGSRAATKLKKIGVREEKI